MLETWVDIILKLGLPTGLVLIFLFLIVRYINKKDSQNRIDTKEQIKNVREDAKEQIKTLREEHAEDRQLFKDSIKNFETAVNEFKCVQKETNTIKCDIVEVKNDLLIIKTKMDK